MNYNPFLNLIIEYFHIQHYAKTHDTGADHDLNIAQLRYSGSTPINWYGSKIKIYNTKNKLQATDFIPAESFLAKDSGNKVTAKSYCPYPVHFI